MEYIAYKRFSVYMRNITLFLKLLKLNIISDDKMVYLWIQRTVYIVFLKGIHAVVHV